MYIDIAKLYQLELDLQAVIALVSDAPDYNGKMYNEVLRLNLPRATKTLSELFNVVWNDCNDRQKQGWPLLQIVGDIYGRLKSIDQAARTIPGFADNVLRQDTRFEDEFYTWFAGLRYYFPEEAWTPDTNTANLGKGLRAASFTSTEGVAGVEGREAGNGQETAKAGAVKLPSELDTPEARKRFAKAVEAGYMEATSTGYKWLGKGKVRLAYFVYRIYSPKGEIVPISKVCSLFNTYGIGDSYTQLKQAKWFKDKDRQYTPPPDWVEDIDRLFID
jgi:hypothetical protein